MWVWSHKLILQSEFRPWHFSARRQDSHCPYFYWLPVPFSWRMDVVMSDYKGVFPFASHSTFFFCCFPGLLSCVLIKTWISGPLGLGTVFYCGILIFCGFSKLWMNCIYLPCFIVNHHGGFDYFAFRWWEKRYHFIAFFITWKILGWGRSILFPASLTIILVLLIWQGDDSDDEEKKQHHHKHHHHRKYSDDEWECGTSILSCSWFGLKSPIDHRPN